MNGRAVRFLRRATVATVITVTMLAVGAGSASAHPLGNFTVNYYEGVSLSADHVGVSVVVDSAELPTYNRIQPAVDTNHDGRFSADESAAYADAQCARLARSLVLTDDGARLAMQASAGEFALLPSKTLRGLSTGRLTCQLTAPAQLTRPAELRFDDHVDATYGWHEITVVGSDVHVTSSSVNGTGQPVASRSISDELRRYPGGLLSTPLNIRSAAFRVAPGSGPAAAGAYQVARPGALTRALQPLTNAFEGAAGSRHLTLPVVALAIALSMLLGAGHAALPGHGKTVMAAYLVGRRGTLRDAVLVGATVTMSHTVGVITLGLAIALSAAWVDTTTLQYLGVVSGLLIASVGIGLLRSSVRFRRQEGPQPHDHDDHGHEHHGHGHEHHGHGHEHHGHDHHGHDHADRPSFTRRGLVGLGVAGGLVPSPSALVVLLSAIALGRTAFGVVLVLGYGVGMALTLMLAGLALARVSHKAGGAFRARFTDRYAGLVPLLTAALVIVVGCGLALRSAALG